MEKRLGIYEDGLVEKADYAGEAMGEVASMKEAATADTGAIRDPFELEHDPLRAYLKGISRMSLLTKEGEVQ